MRNDDLVIMGFVRGASGVRGSLKVHADTEYADSLFDYPVWWLGKDGDWRPFDLVDGEVRPNNALVVNLAGVTDRDQAEAMRGMQIAVPRSEFPEAGDGEYYWRDLIGLEVVNLQGESFGKVSELTETGAHDLLVVDGDRRRLIPFVESIVPEVDLKAGRIVVDWGADY